MLSTTVRCVRSAHVARTMCRSMASLPARDGSTADMKAFLEAQMSSAGLTEKFGGKGVDVNEFTNLLQSVNSNVTGHEASGLFVSMDASQSGVVTANELFVETALAILKSRLNVTGNVHPVGAAYDCLPSPPFETNAIQQDCLKLMVKVHDQVVKDFTKTGGRPKPLKYKRAGKATKAPPAVGFMSSLFAKAPPPAKAAAADKPVMRAIPQCAKGMYLYGGTGCGKTVLLDIFSRSLPAEIPFKRLHWHEFVRDAFRMTNRPKTHEDENVIDSAALAIATRCKVLLLDGVVVTHVSEALQLKDMCTALWARGVTTIMTSNYHPSKLFDSGLNRELIESWLPDLEAVCPVFDFQNTTDFRLAGGSDMGNFVSPLGDESDAQFQGLIGGVMGSNKMEENVVFEIPGEGRQVTLPGSGIAADGSKACVVDFHDLFDKPLGRALYASLATEYATVFLKNCPSIDSDNSDVLRRFCMFMDIVYDKKCNFYIQAAVAPEQLYTMPDLTEVDVIGAVMDDIKSWRRAKSMLIEMKSLKYASIVKLSRNQLVASTVKKSAEAAERQD